MEDLIQAIATNDIVKVKQCFNEAMEEKVKIVLENRKREIAAAVMIEGEEKAVEDEEDDEESEDEDDDESEEDEEDEDEK